VRGVEPVLISATQEVDPALADCEHHPILPPLFTGRMTTLRTMLKTPEVRRILRTCDLVHCPVELYAPLVAGAKPAGMPFVLSAFGTWAIRPLEGRLMPLYRRAFSAADRVLVISDFTRRWMARLMDLPRAEVLAGGVHPDRFTDPVKADDLPEWIGKEPVLFSAGAVKPRKGQHIALEAVGLARKEIPTLHYAMAGGLDAAPEYVNHLRERAAELGMSDDVHFLGQLPPYGSLTAWYQQADAFILPSVNQGSSFEGLGFVFLEAGAAGTPSIGTRDCGAEEAVVDGVTGYLVPQDDPQETASAILRLLADPAQARKMGEAAREHARSLSWDHLVDRVLEVYGELSGES
jgi:phosphatidylinositol alpha-1,6-mannosyltransferase